MLVAIAVGVAVAGNCLRSAENSQVSTFGEIHCAKQD